MRCSTNMVAQRHGKFGSRIVADPKKSFRQTKGRISKKNCLVLRNAYIYEHMNKVSYMKQWILRIEGSTVLAREVLYLGKQFLVNYSNIRELQYTTNMREGLLSFQR